MLEGLARFQEYMVRYGWEMCFSLVRTVGMVGWYGWLVRLVRLVPFVGTLEPYQPYPETVPMNRTTVPYQIKGGVKGGAFWMYHWYGTVVRFIGAVSGYGWYGRYGW